MGRGGTDRAAVVGVGTIGAGWATLFAANGYEVTLFDECPEYLQRSRELVEAALSFLFAHGLGRSEAGPEGAEDAKKRLVMCDTLEEALTDVGFVQESIVEDYARKSELYDQLEAVVPSSTPVASSSSGLLITKLQADRRHPQRFLIGHPWNPPYLIPLVEIVPGQRTLPAVVEQVRSVYESLGMDAILVTKEIPGHVGNRLAAALWREAIALVVSGAASVEDVDKAIRSGPGLRWALMGAHLTYHLGGGPEGIRHFIDHLGPAFETWWADIAAWSELPAEAESMLAEGIGEVTGSERYEDMVERRDELLASLLKLNRSRRERNPLVVARSNTQVGAD
jgi:carnitine 3-dehydrogenase